MDSISNYPGVLKKLRLDKMKKQYKSAPHFSITEGVAKRKELLNKRRKIAKGSSLDTLRDLEEPNQEVVNSKEQIKQRILEWKMNKEKQKKEPVNKLKPFLAGAIKVPLYYVPPPPLPKNKQKDKAVNTNGGGCKYNKQVPNIPKTSESNLTRPKKYQLSHSINSKKEKYQTISKISQPKLQAGSSKQSKLRVVSEEDPTVSNFQMQLNTEVDRILKMCVSWDKIFKTAKLPDFIQELVLEVTGQGRLLVSQKMEQFRSLIEASKKQNRPGMSGAAPVLSQDLHGFWDMIYLQVKDIDKRFGKLEQLKANNWEQERSKKNKTPSKKGCTKNVSKPQKKAVSSRVRELVLEARKRMMARKHLGNEAAEDVKTLDTRSFTIQWATRKADGQLEVPSTSGTVPPQYASAPGTSCSAETPFKGELGTKIAATKTPEKYEKIKKANTRDTLDKENITHL